MGLDLRLGLRRGYSRSVQSSHGCIRIVSETEILERVRGHEIPIEFAKS